MTVNVEENVQVHTSKTNCNFYILIEIFTAFKQRSLPDLDLFSIGCFFLEIIYYGILQLYNVYDSKYIFFIALPYIKVKKIHNKILKK